jgi:hypothetical protein
MFLEIAIGAGLIWGITKVVSKAQAADKIVVDVSSRIHKITFTQITISCDAKVKNPSNQNFRFRRPFVTLSYQGKTLGTSDVKDTLIELAPYTEIEIKNIVIEIQLLQLPAVLMDVYNRLKTAQGTLTLDVQTIVPMVTNAGDVPVKFDEKINY